MQEILERIAGRYIEEGECWIWTGATVQGGRPYLTLTDRRVQASNRKHRYKRHPLRKLIAKAKNIYRKGDVNPSKCGNPLCVNPDHVVSIPKKKHMSQLGRMGGTDPKRMVTIQTSTHPGKKLTDEQIVAIRASTDSSAAIAKQFGVSSALISRVRLHQTRKHLNPFAGLIK